MDDKRELIQQEAIVLSTRLPRCSLAISMGVGKTLIGLRYLEQVQSQSMKELKVLIVAPKLSIFDSWKSDAEKFKIELKAEFTTYLSLNKKNPHDYDILILDECHSLLPTHHTFLAVYAGRILGLTGTPPRYPTSEKGVMLDTYCPVVYKYITDTAVEDKILNDYRINVHMLPLSSKNTVQVKTAKGTFYTSEVNNYKYWTDRINNASTKMQNKMGSIFRMKALMEYKTKEMYAKSLLERIDEKCIVFCNTQAQADRICKHSYHSENIESEYNLTLFKNDDIMELSCVLQLNEGVNIPNLKAGIILHSYGNERKSSQRIGRLLRLNPTETAMVHILCYKNTIDEKWVKEALKDLDSTKIKYYDATTSDV